MNIPVYSCYSKLVYFFFKIIAFQLLLARNMEWWSMSYFANHLINILNLTLNE